DILVQPKNAVTKQYQKLFSYEGVDLKFTEKALKAIAQMALKRKTGARGLRGVIESAMMDIMFDLPSKPNVKECIIDEKVINEGAAPKLVYKTEDEIRQEAAKSENDPAESA
ncbi:MAG: ATP-dependent Clp protease ATP-binding subunit ClpX, partial [Pseudobdellovibrionaceae bacterium]